MSAPRPTADDQKLTELLLGQLPPDEAEQLSATLANDSRVVPAAESLPQDTLMAVVKGAQTEVDTAGDQLSERLVERLQPTIGTVTMTGVGPAVAGDDEPIPAMLEYFRVEKVLGQGGMGTVYLADDTRLGRKVAVKTLRAAVARKPGAKERFFREARMAAALEHECLVPIYYVGESGDTPFLTMPLLKGRGLDDHLEASGGKLAVAEAVRVGSQVAGGLAVAHAAGLIHRDIKPSNIWVDADGRRVRILDFGLARFEEDDTNLTASGMIVGTPAYMAPEQARGEVVDARADLFSLGVVLYQMLTGKRPFTGNNTVAVLTSLALDIPTAPNLINPECPAALSDLVMRLLGKSPGDRPATAAAVKAALDRLDGAALDADRTQPDLGKVNVPRPQPIPKPTPKAAPRRQFPRAAMAVALGLLVLVGGGAAALVQLVFSNKDGTLVVEVDEAADVRFKNGKLEVYDEAGKKLYTLEPSDKNKALPPGKYTVKVVGADGVKLDTETFEMEKNGKAFVKVTATGPKDVAVVDPKKPEPVKPGVPGTPSGAGLRVDQQVGGPLAVAAEVPDLKVPGDGPFTVEGWVKIDRPTHGENPHFFGWTYQFVVGSNGLGIGASLFADEGKGGWKQHPIHAPDALERGKWQHLAAVRDGKQNRLYINGALAAKGDVAVPIHTALSDPPEGIFVIGQVCDGVAFREVRVSKVARYSGDKPFTPAPRFEPDKETLALYHLDEGQGSAITDATGKHHGKVLNGLWGTVPPVTPGTPGGAGLHLFVGDIGAEAPAPALDVQKPWTAEAYFTPLTEHLAKNTCRVVGCVAGMNLGVQDGKYLGYSFHGGTSAGVVKTGERVHVACVQTETKRMLFLNGKLMESTDNPFPTEKFAVGKLQFGLTNNVSNTPPIDVLVDGVRISQAVRYTKDFTPPGRHVPDKETLALYHCDEGSGDKLTDSSGNNLHGKIINAKWGKASAVLPPSVPGTPLALRKPTWKPGPADNVLPGLVSRPAILDGVDRWQVVPTVVPATALAFSPDEKWVATADFDSVRIYDAVTGAFKALGKRTNGVILHGAVLGLDWSHDSKWVRVANFRGLGFDNGDVFTPDGTRSPVPYIQHAGLDFGWNPKFPVFACVVHGTQDRIAVFDPTKKEKVEIVAKQGVKGTAVWSPDGEMLLVVREDKTAQLFARDGTPGAKLAGEVDPSATPAWSADAKQIAAMASANEIGFWKTDGTAGKKTGKHEKAVLALNWKPDGKLLAVTEAEGKRHFWKTDATSEGSVDTKDGTPGFSWAKDGNGFFTPGKFWAAVGNPSFTATRPEGMWDVVSPDQASVLQVRRGEIMIAAMKDGEAKDIGWKVFQTRDGMPWWSADGKRLAVAEQNGVSLYDARDAKKLVRLGGGVGVNGLNRAAFSPKGDRLAVANDIGHLLICEPTGKPLRVVGGPPKAGATLADAIHDLNWHPNGKLLAVTTGAGTVTVFDTDTGKAEATTSVAGIRAGGSAVFSPANPDHLLIAHPDAAALWRWKVEKEPIQMFDGLGKLIPSPDGKKVLSLQAGGGHHGNDFRSAVIVSPDLKDRDTAGTKEYIPQQQHPGASLAWHPDGKHLVVTRTGVVGGSITIRSLDGKVVEEIKPDGIDVTWLEWVSPFARQNVLVGRIGQGPDTYLFDLTTKKLTSFGKVSGEITVSPDGKHLIALEGSTLTYWGVESKAVEQRVVLLPNGEFVTLSAAGEVLEASAKAGDFYRYVVEDKSGKLLVKTPAEMARNRP